jgi:hypothetical protein
MRRSVPTIPAKPRRPTSEPDPERSALRSPGRGGARVSHNPRRQEHDVEQAGRVVGCEDLSRISQFPSVDALMHTEIQATPLAKQISESASRRWRGRSACIGALRILRCGYTPPPSTHCQCDEARIGRFRLTADDVKALGGFYLARLPLRTYGRSWIRALPPDG